MENNYPKFSNILKWISFISLLISGFIHLIRSFVAKDYSYIGTVTFENFMISINDDSDYKNFNLREVNSLKITYGGYSGKMDSYYKSFYTEDGANNWISFKLNDTKYEYRFLIQDRNSELWLNQYADYLKKGGIKLIVNNSYNMLKSRWKFK
jgi:hypothetical protein